MTIDPPFRRKPPSPEPDSPPPVVATFVAEFNVQESQFLFTEARRQMEREGASSEEIDDALCRDGVVNIGECICTLMRGPVDRICSRSRIAMASPGEVYLEPTSAEDCHDRD